MKCDVLPVSHLLGKRWAVPLIEDLALQKFNGFNSFVKKSRTTPTTLSRRLKELEKMGIVKKVSKHSGRAATSYSLMRKGREIHEIIAEIKKWNMRWNSAPSSCLKISCTECELFQIKQN